MTDKPKIGDNITAQGVRAFMDDTNISSITINPEGILTEIHEVAKRREDLYNANEDNMKALSKSLKA